MHQNPKFGWGSASDPDGAYSTPPDILAGFKGPTKGRGVRGGSGGEGTGSREERDRVLWSPKNPVCNGSTKSLKDGYCGQDMFLSALV